MIEVISMVALDQLPDLQAIHEDAVCLVLYSFQFLRSDDLVFFRRDLGRYCRIDIDIDGNMLANFFTLCFFFTPIIEYSQPIQLRFYLCLD